MVGNITQVTQACCNSRTQRTGQKANGTISELHPLRPQGPQTAKGTELSSYCHSGFVQDVNGCGAKMLRRMLSSASACQTSKEVCHLVSPERSPNQTPTANVEKRMQIVASPPLRHAATPGTGQTANETISDLHPLRPQRPQTPKEQDCHHAAPVGSCRTETLAESM